jgi:tetratricopeptide (TPR) repeat protein
MKTPLKYLLIVIMVGFPLLSFVFPQPADASSPHEKKQIAKASSFLKNPTFQKSQAALKIFRKVLKENPRSIPAHMGIVYVCLYQYNTAKKKDKMLLSKGIKHTNIVLGYNPKFVEAYKKKSYLQFYQGHHKQAINTIKIGMRQVPQANELVKTYLTLLIKTEKIPEAEKICRTKKVPKRNSAPLYLDLGQVWLDAGFPIQARLCFSRSLAAEETAAAWAATASSFVMEKNWQKAAWFYEWALKADPTYYDLYYDLAACYNQSGHKKKAIVWLAPYTKIFPDDIRALMELAVLYEETGNNTRARLTWMKVKSGAKTADQKKVAQSRIKKLKRKKRKTK